jgi:hypothetical protein
MRKRTYSEADVRAIFIRSEKRVSPASGHPGHSGSSHNTISRSELELRQTGSGFATAFGGGFRDQIRAATTLLNSPEGQDRLGELDAGGPGTRRRIEGEVVPGVAIRYGMGMGEGIGRTLPADALPSTQVRMVVDATEDSIHIHTIFPLLPGQE